MNRSILQTPLTAAAGALIPGFIAVKRRSEGLIARPIPNLRERLFKDIAQHASRSRARMKRSKAARKDVARRRNIRQLARALARRPGPPNHLIRLVAQILYRRRRARRPKRQPMLL